MLLALVPQRVGDFDQVEGNTTAIDVLLPDLRTHGVIGVSANGVLGDPRSADAGDGQLAIERCSMNLVQAVGDWSTDAAGMLVTADRTQPDSPRS
jgi:creatinine amidohydrolase